jgi:hypothetical protein
MLTATTGYVFTISTKTLASYGSASHHKINNNPTPNTREDTVAQLHRLEDPPVVRWFAFAVAAGM